MNYEEEPDSFIIFIVFIYSMLQGICFVIHLWTTLIAFKVFGFIAAILTFIFPFISELFWFLKIGNNTNFNSIYCVIVAIFFIPLILINLFVDLTNNN